MKTYVGVGSRATPELVMTMMASIARRCAKAGLILRSGGAKGADSAFEQSCTAHGGKKEIFYPDGTISPEAYKLAGLIHPAWDRCSEWAKAAHARNCHQVLGANLDSPADFLVCWTLNGEDIGGTRTAIVLARMKGIPLFNLGKQADIDRLLTFLKENNI